MIRIVAPYFVAGVVLENGSVIRAADIVSYMLGKSSGWVMLYCLRKGWKTEHFP